jgi:hypothetical protein
MLYSFKILIIGCFSLFTFKGCNTYDNKIELKNQFENSSNFPVSLNNSNKKKVQLNNNLKIVLSECISYKNLFEKIFKTDKVNNEIINLDKKEIEELFQNLITNIPEVLNNQNILSRINVLKSNTIMLNYVLRNDSLNKNLKKTLENRLLNSYFDLNNQMNLIHEKHTQIIIN